GWMERLLAKQPARRFATAEAAADCLRRLTTAPPAAPLVYRAAAGQHVGLGKATKNPTNQDRAVFWTSNVSDNQLQRAAFEGFSIEENYRTTELAGDVLIAAIADGISTACCGEFAAQSIADAVRTFAQQGQADQRPPAALLAELFERANTTLGEAILR